MYKTLCGDNQSLRDLFTINEPRTRGHNFKLYKPFVQATIRKYFLFIYYFIYSLFKADLYLTLQKKPVKVNYEN